MPEQNNQSLPEQNNQSLPEQSNQSLPEQNNQSLPEQNNQSLPEQNNQSLPKQNVLPSPKRNGELPNTLPLNSESLQQGNETNLACSIGGGELPKELLPPSITVCSVAPDQNQSVVHSTTSDSVSTVSAHNCQADTSDVPDGSSAEQDPYKVSMHLYYVLS